MVAEQLTAGPGYDFQPDWSPDGSRIAFVRYNDDAMELAVLDTATGKVTPLTRNGAVNVEPRWSPDGRRLACVSTAGTGHFHVFVGDVTQGRHERPGRLARAAQPGATLLLQPVRPRAEPDLVARRPRTHVRRQPGNRLRHRRDLAAADSAPEAQPVAVRVEETNWKARPDWSPDGRRVIWSSYAGRQWHQLWITTAAGGGDPFALTYGDFDVTGARWSPDGQRIAFISNERGTTADPDPGRRSAASRQVSTSGRSVTSSPSATCGCEPSMPPAGRWRHESRSPAPTGAAWRRTMPGCTPTMASIAALAAFETHYFHSERRCDREPPGRRRYRDRMARAGESRSRGAGVQIAAGQTQALTVPIKPLALPAGWREQWHSGDVHVHMNYGGTYRNTPGRLVAQAEAEDLDVVYDLIVNKEQRIPDIGYFSPQTRPGLHTRRPAGAQPGIPHRLLGAPRAARSRRSRPAARLRRLRPDTAAASLYPTNAVIADLAHEQAALVGYVHPFDTEPDPAKDAQLTNALPVDVALGKIDYYEVVGFSDHRATAAVWHRLLNCGFRISAAAGTDAMANFASLRGPGRPEPRLRPDGGKRDGARLNASSNGSRGCAPATPWRPTAPLLGFTVEGQPPGAAITLAPGQTEIRYRGFLRSTVPVDHLELVRDGKVAQTIALGGDRRTADIEGSLPVTAPGWLLLRAWNDGASPEVFDIYPYATTSPVFVDGDPKAIACGADAEYFLAWLDRIRAAARKRRRLQ